MLVIAKSIPNLNMAPEQAFGIVSSLAAITGLSLAIIVGRKKSLPRPLTLMTFSSFVGALIVIGFSTTTDIVVIASFWAFFGAVQVFVMIPFQLLMQETVPDVIRGKIIALFNLIFSTAQILGMGLGGVIGDAISIPTTFLLSGIFAIICISILAYFLFTHNIDSDVSDRIKQLEALNTNLVD